MNGCRDMGPLVAGFVLGALDPAEDQAMRRHFDVCAHCAREHSELRSIPALLDRIGPDELEAPAPPPSLEQGLLDRVAREGRARREVADASAFGGDGRVRGPRGLRRRARRVALAGAVALAVITLAVAVGLAVLGGDGASGVAYARAELTTTGPGHAGGGRARVTEVPGGTQVRLRVWDLGPSEASYQLWCIRSDGAWVSGGTFHAERGNASVELLAAVHPGDYHRLVVTRRDENGERGPEILRGTLRY